MSRKEFDVSRMRRLKRYAARYGLTILTDEKMKVLGNAGGHAIRDDETSRCSSAMCPSPSRPASTRSKPGWRRTRRREE